MNHLEKQFRQAADEATNLPRRPDNDSLLRLYALYKQATLPGAAPALLIR
jgi:acyl-CoA-binding protein